MPASVHDDELNTFLTDELVKNGDFWLGLHRDSSSADWMWSDGTPFDFTSWQSGHPNLDGEACVDLYTNRFWYDDPCADEYNFICEIDILEDRT